MSFITHFTLGSLRMPVANWAMILHIWLRTAFRMPCCMLQSYNKRHDFATSMAWYAYILKCIAHAAVHHHRKNDSHATYLESLSREQPEKNFEADALEQETLDRLYAAVESLPEEYQRILWMSYREGLKNAEIAARLGIAEITVKKKKAKILAILSDRMGDISPAIFILMMNQLRV